MVINIKPETERLVQQELHNGHFHSVDEMIVQGIQTKREGKPSFRDWTHKTPADAVAHIRELRQGNRLPSGVTIRDLINEGRS